VINDPLTLPDVISAPYPPVNVGKLYNEIFYFIYVCVVAHHIETVKNFIDHYYYYLSVNMDADVVTQLMVSQKLLSEEVIVAAASDYQKNCLILQQVRLMNIQTLESFVELLQNNDSQQHVGVMLSDSE